MNIIYKLLFKFLEKEKFYSIILFILTILLTLFQVNGISYITANIITFMQKKEFNLVNNYFIYFVIASFIMIVVFYIYKIIQNKLVIELSSWIKKEMLDIIFKTNNENFSGINFTEFITPINRISHGSYLLFYNILTEMNNKNYLPVILNTSFNIKGQPILTKISDAFYVLDNTELDCIVYDNKIFKKKNKI